MSLIIVSYNDEDWCARKKKIYAGETSQDNHKYRSLEYTQKQKLLWLAGLGRAIKNGKIK